ncbi:MAG: radical SAM family heme chaperone HemW [Prevotella sp.]|nr:radical SAM family heme chaperone HemW [Prevotella sp.]
MAGLYIHIPFCKSRCIYCAFYSTTQHERMEEYVDSLCKEMELRKTSHSTLHTIYLGGGTPSQLSPALLRRLFNNIYKVYDVAADAEITMECNPDDVTPDYAQVIGELPIDRVSMGAQTFSDERLRFLHRRHTSSQVKEAVELLRRNGIQNISIDLMFGFPGETLQDWEQDIHETLALDVEHLSAYSLMIEEGTELYRRYGSTGVREYENSKEDMEREMYETLIDRFETAGFEHYEISNFAKKGFRSRHNSSYWNGTPYIGLGAAAHSYDIETRHWNIANLQTYIDRIRQGILPIEETETIDDTTRYNDLITTALRTREGISLQSDDQQSNVWRPFNNIALPLHFRDYLLQNAQKNIVRHLLEITDNHLHLTRQGLFVSDNVMSDLILLD